MERPVKRILIACAIVAACVPVLSAQAQEVAPVCDVVAAPWAGLAAHPSGRTLAEAASVTVMPATGEVLRLHPDHTVVYASLPVGEGEETSFGGMAVIHIDRAGRYMVGMSESAWVDVSQGGTPAEARKFGAGPACSGIRKGVSFDLAAGNALLELSGNMTDQIGVIVLPVEDAGEPVRR